MQATHRSSGDRKRLIILNKITKETRPDEIALHIRLGEKSPEDLKCGPNE